jgi:pseudouridine-5'-phosphate glycosidase
VLRAKWALGLGGGAVIANPIPAEFALPRELIDAAIGQALDDAARQGLSGKAITPFLLDRVNTLTGGDSLAANIQLVRSNARLASAVAVALMVDGPAGRPDQPKV